MTPRHDQYVITAMSCDGDGVTYVTIEDRIAPPIVIQNLDTGITTTRYQSKTMETTFSEAMKLWELYGCDDTP